MASVLHLSSCLFATVVVHVYYLQAQSYHHIYLLLTVTSILFHTTRGDIIGLTDKIVAHIAYIMVLLDTEKAIAAEAEWLLLFPLMAACLWFGQSCLPALADDMHLGLHLVTVMGMHVYLWKLY